MDKSQWIAYLTEKGICTESKAGRWGSCQYASATDFFDLYFKIRKELSREDALDALGCKLVCTGRPPFLSTKFALFRLVWDDFRSEVQYFKTFPFHNLSIYKSVLTVHNFDDVMSILRDYSWDLWSASRFVCNLAFEQFSISAPPSLGIGPIFNALAQSDNFRTGLECAILLEEGIIMREESFMDFDT